MTITEQLAEALRSMIERFDAEIYSEYGGTRQEATRHAEADPERAVLSAWDANPRATIDTQAAILSVADDYMGDRTTDDREGLEELVNEAIGHACMVLGVSLELPQDEEIHDAIAEELTDRHTTVSDESRSNGPRL